MSQNIWWLINVKRRRRQYNNVLQQRENEYKLIFFLEKISVNMKKTWFIIVIIYNVENEKRTNFRRDKSSISVVFIQTSKPIQ